MLKTDEPGNNSSETKESYNNTTRHTVKQNPVNTGIIFTSAQLEWVKSFSTDNRYTPNNRGPFFVHLYDARREKFVGNCHRKIGKILKEHKVECEEILKGGADKVIVFFNLGIKANEFVDRTANLINPYWVAVIPDLAVYQVGIVHDVPRELEIDDIWEGLDDKSKQLIFKIERCKSKAKGRDNRDEIIWEDSEAIKIFSKKEIPKHIEIYMCPTQVQNLIAPTRRCFRCQRFGHQGYSCNLQRRCVQCREAHEGKCKNPKKCANCLGPHTANDASCIFYLFHREVNYVKSKLGKNNFQAILIVKNRFREIFEAQKSQAYELLMTLVGEDLMNLSPNI